MQKYIILKSKQKKMQEVKAKCTDIVIRRTYNKRYYLYFYQFSFQKENINISDKIRWAYFQNKIEINKQYLMYVNPQDPNDYLTPIETMTSKWYLYLSLLLFVISLFLFL